MLNTLVAIVLGNAVVATVFALGVVLLARWHHKPALLHGLWVVVFLKLITPPMLTISVPVQMTGLVSSEQDAKTTASDSFSEALPTSAPEISRDLVKQPLNVSTDPTIVIEAPLEPEDVSAQSMIAEQDPFADFPVETVSVDNAADGMLQENSIPSLPREADSLSSASVGFPAITPAESFTHAEHRWGWTFSWRTLLWPVMWIWGAGVLIVFLSAWRQILRFERSLRQAVPADEALRNRVAHLARQLGLAEPPNVYLLNGAVSPMLWGFGRKPRLLLPRDLLTGLNEEAIETLILHELAHMRRGDHWVRVLELLCQCIYWWHPVVWWGRKQLRIVEEECCDAFVVEHSQGGVYARALLATVDFLSQHKPILPPAASGLGHLEFLKRRLTMIIEGGVSARLAGFPKFFLLTAAVVALSILPRLVAQTAADSAEDSAAEAESTKAETDLESKDAGPIPTLTNVKPPLTLIRQEPLEFEKQPKGYPSAQLEVRDLAFSPDGKLLAAGYGKWDTAGDVVIYEYATKRVLKKFPFEKGVASVVFSVDGKYLVASTFNYLLQIWDAESWDLVAEKTTGTRVARVAFSANGKYLAWGNEAGELKLVTVGEWDEERAITGDFYRFQKVAVSPDSKLLVAVGGRFSSPNEPRFGRGLVFEVESGKQIAKFDSTGPPFGAVAFSPDGKEIATGEFTNNTVAFWEPGTGKQIAMVNLSAGVREVNYAPDGRMAAASGDGTIYVMKDHRIERQMIGHEGVALSAVFTPDGKTLVTGAEDATIRVWNPETGVPVETIRPNESLEDTQDAVLAIAHSPDGRFVVTTHEDASVRLRNAEDGTFLRLLKGHEDVVSTVAFSPDGKTLATGSYDHLVKLWNVETGELLRDLKGHTNWVFSVAFSPDGKTLASGGYDKTIRIWNAADGKSAGVLEGHTAAVRSLAYSPDGAQLVSGGSDRTLRLWDLKTQKTVQEFKGHTAAVRAVAFSPDGTKIASGSEDNSLRFWNPKTGESTQELKGHTGMVWTLAFSPRGRTLASGGFDNTLRIWNGETGAPLQTLTGHKDVITSLSYAPNSSSLVTGSYDKTLKLWPAIEPPIPALADLNIGDSSTTPGVRFVVFTPDGQRMITGNQNTGIRLWDMETGRAIKTVYQPRGIGDGALSPDGKLLATAGYGKQSYLWNAETLELLATLDTHEENTVVAFSPDGKTLAVGSWDGAITLWNVETREKLRELPKQDLPVGGLEFSPDGTFLATGTGNYKEYQKAGTVKLWDTKSWEEVANLPGPTMKIRRVKFSPDGKTLVAGGAQPELLVYDVKDRKLVTKIPIGNEVTTAAFFPDSRTLALGLYGGGVGLWSLNSRTRIVRFEGHEAAIQAQRNVFDIAVSRDASVVASAGADGHVKLWPTSAQPPLKPLASLALQNAEALSVALSPDGSRLAVATTAKTVEIRDTKTGSVLKTIGGFKTSCVSMAYAPDGKSIAGASQSGWATIWNAETGEKLISIDAHAGGARRAVFSPDGRMLATCGWDETAAVWNISDGSLRYRTEKQGLALSDVLFSPEGKLLITGTGSYHEWRKPGSMKIWNAEDGTFIADYGSHEAEIKGILLDGGGRLLVTYGGNGAKVWDRIGRKMIRSIGTGTTITAAALSPDGSTLFTGDRSGRLMVYAVETGRVGQSLEGHAELVYDVALSADGTLLASASKDGSVNLWPGNSIPAPALLTQTFDDPEQSRSIAYSPDGKWMAVGGKDKTISLRDASSLQEVKHFAGHEGMVFQLVFTPDSKALLSSSSDGTVRSWEITNGREVARWTVHAEKLANVRSLAVTPDGKRFAAGNQNGECGVWDLETRKELYRLPHQPPSVTGIAFSPDGQLLATCTGDWQQWKTPGELKLWNAQTGEAIATLQGHDGEIKGVLFNRDGKLLISYGSDQSVRIWDVATRRLLRKQDCPHNVSAAALINEQMLVFGDTLGALYLADLQQGGIRMQTRGHFDFLSGIAVSADGTRFATVSHDGYFKTWSTMPPQLAIRHVPAPQAAHATPLAEKIRHWQPLASVDLGTVNLTRVKVLNPHGDKVWFAVYSPDGTTLATGGDDKTVKLWNAETWELLATLTGHEAFTTHAAFSPDGTKIATVAWEADKSIKLWDVATGKVLASAAPHEGGCRKVAFSPDGQMIATACEDGYLRLFNKDLALNLSLNLGLNVYGVTFSPDGKTLAVGTGNWREKKDGRLRLYDAGTGKMLKEFAGSDGYIFHMQFLKDGRHLLANNAGAGCAIWDVETSQMLETYRKEKDTRWVEISRDEKRIIASVSLGQVQIWNRNASQPIADFKASEKFVHVATFSPDGKRIVVGAEDGTLSIWEMQPGNKTQVAESTAAPQE